MAMPPKGIPWYKGSDPVNGVVDFFRSLGPAKLASMAIVGASLIGFFFYITMHLAAPKMSLLYTDLDAADSAKIVEKLQAQGIPYQTSSDGATILVPEDEVLKVRMAIAKDGVLSSSSVGYEIFDRTDALGTTNFVQNINHVRALEGELARTIRSIDNVTAARVDLGVSQRQLSSTEERRRGASSAVTTRDQLTAAQFQPVQNLVAAAVPELDPRRVSIIGQMGVLLAKVAGQDGP